MRRGSIIPQQSCPGATPRPEPYDNGCVRRNPVGVAVGVGAAVGVGLALLPLRSHLSVATAALVLVVPVVAGSVIGGFGAGVAAVLAGFLVFDLLFVPPYGRLTVTHAEDLVALGVYVVVMVVVARLVARLDAARSEARARYARASRLAELSELLVENRSVDGLLESVVRAVATLVDVPSVALLVPDGNGLRVAASAGEPLGAEQIARLEPGAGLPVRLGTAPGESDGLQTVAMTTGGEPVGLLALGAVPRTEEDRALLRTFANHAALALERAALQEQALRSQLLEEVDRLRHAMVGAVSHDLRTPLATIKVASSTLVESAEALTAQDTRELHLLIDVEADRLNRLVTSLLDMTRIDAGVLEVHRATRSVPDLVLEAVATLHPSLGDRAVTTDLPERLPEVEVDPLLIGQVLANLLDNANRHAPPDTTITVAGEVRGDRVALSVADEGPGVPPAERDQVFDRFVRFDTGGRTGLGLAIAKTFVEAHGERIWVEESERGSRFVFTMPLADQRAAGGHCTVRHTGHGTLTAKQHG